LQISLLHLASQLQTRSASLFSSEQDVFILYKFHVIAKAARSVPPSQ